MQQHFGERSPFCQTRCCKVSSSRLGGATISSVANEPITVIGSFLLAFLLPFWPPQLQCPIRRTWGCRPRIGPARSSRAAGEVLVRLRVLCGQYADLLTSGPGVSGRPDAAIVRALAVFTAP